MSKVKGQHFKSLSEVVEKYYDDLLAFISHKCGSRSLAEEVVQETWLRAYRTAALMPDNPRAYVYRMARNLLIDHHRRNILQENLKSIGHEGISDGATERFCSVKPETTSSQEDVFAAKQELQMIANAVDGLPSRCREVFLLYRGQELSMKEISAKLGISVKTVENHITRAMVECRSILQYSKNNM